MRIEPVSRKLFKKYVTLGCSIVESMWALMGYTRPDYVEDRQIEKAMLKATAINRKHLIRYLNQYQDLTALLRLLNAGTPMTPKGLYKEQMLFEQCYARVFMQKRDIGFDAMAALYETMNVRYGHSIAGPLRTAQCIQWLLTIPTYAQEVLTIIPEVLYMADVNDYRAELKRRMNARISHR